jgi:ADP-ribose pyrophosphatase YjhB (NUDIX family)
MTTDIYPRIAVNLVIFTVVENKSVLGLEGLGLVSLVGESKDFERGLSLFVVTMQGEHGRVLPGGHLRGDETIEQAARRIAHESLGVSLKTRLRPLASFDQPDRNPGHRDIAFPYWGMVNFEDISQFLGGRDRVGLELVNSQGFLEAFNLTYDLNEYDGVSRFGNRSMPNAKKRIGHAKQTTADFGDRILALDHDDMVFFAWRQLRHAFTGKLDPFRYLSINPLGEQFRLSDLQEFQEVCRGERLQRDAFRRMMLSDASYLRKTNGTDSERPGKPAILYSLEAPPADEDFR